MYYFDRPPEERFPFAATSGHLTKGFWIDSVHTHIHTHTRARTVASPNDQRQIIITMVNAWIRPQIIGNPHVHRQTCIHAQLTIKAVKLCAAVYVSVWCMEAGTCSADLGSTRLQLSTWIKTAEFASYLQYLLLNDFSCLIIQCIN